MTEKMDFFPLGVARFGTIGLPRRQQNHPLKTMSAKIKNSKIDAIKK